ncbi:hypothetical protein C6341_g21688 [Phytophthora cactorum]|nr:hypothetical protein C6341_g21688 [Phytophthora cactorum]
MRARRTSNRERVHSRIQQRQIARAVIVQSEVAQSAGISPRVEVTQIERVVNSRRFASPELLEDPARRQRLQAALLRAERRLEGRAAARCLQLPEAVPDDILTSIHDVNRPTVREPGSRPGTSASVCETLLPSCATEPSVRNHALGTRSEGYPAYEQLASALRNLTPDVPTQDESSLGFPSYAQLNAALRNLSPEQLSQDQPSLGFPTYEQRAQALRNLSPPTPVTDTSNNGFPTYGQLAAAPRDLRTGPRRSRAPRSPCVSRYAALPEISEFVPVPRHLLPQRSVRRQHCGAMKWPSEFSNACCLHGDVKLAAAETPPPRVCELYSQRSFLDKIRGYNSAFTFTLTGAMEDRTVNRGSAPYTFRVNGAMHHRIGQLLHPEGANPTFARIYVYDGSTEEEVALRGLAISSGLNHTTLEELQSILHEINSLAAVYQSARDHASASQDACLVLLDNPRVDPRRYNRPTAEEVAAIMVDGGPPASHSDVVLRYRRGGLQRMFETHPLYDPLQYPLIYLRGEIEWSIHTQYVEGVRRNNN